LNCDLGAFDIKQTCAKSAGLSLNSRARMNRYVQIIERLTPVG
jgi:hypothetical protein